MLTKNEYDTNFVDLTVLMTWNLDLFLIREEEVCQSSVLDFHLRKTNET